MEKISVGSSHRLTLDSLAVGGEAVGRIGDMVVFVPYGVPGDDVEIRVGEIKKNYARGEIFRIFSPSPHRIEPPCPIFYKCGGCQLQHLSYGAQVLYKRKMIEETIQHIGGIKDIRVDDVQEALNSWNYRNKMQVVAAAKPFLPPSKKISPYFGLYAKRTHRVIKMEECAIQHPLNNRLLKVVRDIINRQQWDIYNDKTGKGLLRYLVTRVSVSRNEILLILVTTSTKVPGIQEFVSAVTQKVPELKGVIINKNDKRTNVVLGNVFKTVWGDDFLIEEVGDIKYRVSANSFFQVNPPQLEKMFKILDELLTPSKKEILLDAYCGVGAIALWLAGKFRRVIGIEEVPQAKKDALISASMNNIGNLEIHTGKVEKILPGLYHEGIKIDKVVLDPPRKGCEEKVLDFITKMRIPKVIYISCNPSTLARDLAMLRDRKYRVEFVKPLDMFPQTYHIESIVSLVYDPGELSEKTIAQVPGTKKKEVEKPVKKHRRKPKDEEKKIPDLQEVKKMKKDEKKPASEEADDKTEKDTEDTGDSQVNEENEEKEEKKEVKSSEPSAEPDEKKENKEESADKADKGE